MSEGDQDLLPIARANRAMRNFQLTLQDLCLQTVARNEKIYAVESHFINQLRALPACLKTRLLKELSRQVFGTLRYPASEHRVELVKLLITGRLEKFDFVVCGDQLDKATNEQLWSFLADQAGQSLRCVRDRRVTSGVLKTRSLEWCLHSVARMPRLQELHLTTLCVGTEDELLQLAAAVPQLKSLEVHLEKSKELPYCAALHSMRALEELLVFHKNIFTTTCSDKWIPLLFEKMPQLKINCLRADELHPKQRKLWHVENRHYLTNAAQERYSVEHLCITRQAHNFISQKRDRYAKVKHLLVMEMPVTYENDFQFSYKTLFNQLSSLHLQYYCFDTFIAPTLAVDGIAITKLILDEMMDEDGAIDAQIDVFIVLDHCKNLETLIVRGGYVGSRVELKPSDIENVPLKNLHLINVDVIGDKVLAWLLRAPLLEELCLEGIKELPICAMNEATRDVSSGNSLRKLRTFRFSLNRSRNRKATNDRSKCQPSALLFSRTVLASCPHLCQAEVDLLLNKAQKSTLAPYLDFVNT